MISKAWLIATAFLLVTACRPQSPDPDRVDSNQTASTQTEVEQTAITPVQPHGEENQLTRAVGLVLGAPLPNGLTLVHRDDVVARYVTEHSIDLVSELYQRELDGFAMERSESVVKFQSDDDEAPVIFLVGGEEDLIRVIYFGAEADAEMTVELDEIFQDEPSDETPSAPPFPQGPTATDPDWVRPATPERTPTTEFPLYQAHVEERDGETVQVLVLREQGEQTVLTTPETDEEPAGDFRFRQTGAFDRGDGQRSIRSIVEVDDSGQPLPFVGTTRYQLPEDFEN